MEINTTRFGRVEIEPGDVIRFPEGVIGLGECRDWVLLADQANDALAWLQSTEQSDVALAVVSPRRFVCDYQMRVTQGDLAPLELDGNEQAQVVVIVTAEPDSATLNLKAPLVLNLNRRLGRQVVAHGNFPVDYPLGAEEYTLRKTA